MHVRSYNLIKSLANRGHQISLATLWSDKSDLVDIERLRPFCSKILSFPLPRWRSYQNSILALLKQDPLQSIYCWNPEMARSLDTLIDNQAGQSPIDLIHIEHLRGVRYGLSLEKNRNSKTASAGRAFPPIVWDSVDNISLLFRQSSVHSRRLFSRLITRLELSKTEQYEAWLSHRFSRILVTSCNDKKAFLDLQPGKSDTTEICVIPNGVDISFFEPGPADMRQKDTLVISGKMSYHANVTMCLDFVNKVMPMVWAKRPQVKLWLVGKDPTPELRSLGNHPAIKVTGTVADISPYLQQASLAVAPLTYGVGIQNKVLEAMACATPVVASPQAVSALSIVPGEDVAVAQSPQEFSSVIMGLLDNSTERERLGLRGRKYVEENHRWADIAEKLEEVYYGVLSD